MDSSDRLLVPCLVASLVVNGIGVLVVSNASVFDPSRRPPPPPAAPEARRYTEIPRQPTPTPPPTPKPVFAQPTPPPPPPPTPTPTPVTPPKPTPTSYTRPQAVTSTPRPDQPVAKRNVPLMNLGLGNAGKHGDIEISSREVKSDLAVGAKANTTENVVAPVKQPPAAIAPPPTPVPATPGPPPIPKTTPPPSPPPTPAPIAHRATISSEPAVPLNGWDSITGSITVGDDFDPSQLRRKSVVVSIDTDASGQVKNVSLTQSCGVSTIDDQIRKNCYKQRYRPPSQDGVPLPSHFEHTFNLSF